MPRLFFIALVILPLVVACGGARVAAPPATSAAQQPTVATAADTPSATPQPSESVTAPAAAASAVAASASASATLSSATPTASATAASGLLEFGQGGEDSAVVRRNGSGGWDGRYINPGAMLYHEGSFHMLRNGFVNWPGEISFGYMYSEDGMEWRPAGASPLFTSAAIPFAPIGAAANAVVVADDGTWMLYLHKLSGSGAIARATAPEPIGPWVVDAQPVLDVGGDGAWDEDSVGWHSVVKTNEGYVMYYAGRQASTTLIGRATSPDGITWTKYDDPDTMAPPFAESDPVLSATQDWEGGDVDRPEVRFTPDGWVMLYVGNRLNNRGLALSEDGINWTPVTENPVITSAEFPVVGSTWDTSLLYHDGIYYYYMEIGNMSGTDIYVGRFQGSIRP